MVSDTEAGEAARSLAFGEDAGSEGAFGGLTGPGLRSTLCFRGAAFVTEGDASFAVEIVGGGGVVDTKREPRGYTAREPETRHAAPSTMRAERCTWRGRRRTAATARWCLVTVRLENRRARANVR